MSELDLLRQTLCDYEKLCSTRAGGLPKLALVAVYREHCTAPMDEDLFNKIKRALEENDPHAGGWVRFRSDLGRTSCPLPCYGKSGPPIAAEWLDCKNVAYRLTPDPNRVGQALIVSIEERGLDSEGLPRDNEIPALRECMAIMAAEHAAPFTHLAYRIYWGFPVNGSLSATRRLFYCFAGFRKRS